MALLTIFTTSFIIALSGALMPGPLLTATISESTQRGYKVGPMLMVGHAILELALLVALILGLTPFFTNDTVFVVIALAGACVLFWMAFGMFRSLPSLSLSWESEDKRHGNLVVTGALMSMANPYWIVWWATIGMGYILQIQNLGLWGIAAFFLGHIAADFAWYAFVSTTVDKGRRFLNDKIYKGLIGACAVFLVVFGGMFAYAGMQKILS